MRYNMKLVRCIETANNLSWVFRFPKGLIGIALLFSGIGSVYAQYPDESLLYARTGLSGTARSVGSAGAYGSVGADLGCLEINPAGLGLYRSTDFSITPGLTVGNNVAGFNGGTTSSNSIKPYIGQAGMAWTKLLKGGNDGGKMSFDSHPLRSFTFALNFEQVSLFSRRQSYGAYNSNYSLIDEYVGYANAINQPITFGSYPPEMVLAGPSGGLNLFGFNSATHSYYSNFRAPVTQSGEIQTDGAINKIDFGFGANLADKLYIGISVGVPILDYSVNQQYTESGSDSSAFSDYNINSQLNITGIGFNSSLGLIYRPLPWMRFGASYHLPTWYAMSEDYSTILTADSNIYQNQAQAAYPNAIRYSLRTPMKGDVGASFYYKTFGFISFDYEFENFGASRFKYPNDSVGEGQQVNDSIKAYYKFGHTLKIGLEGSYKILRIRAGYSYVTSPYKKDEEITPGYTGSRNLITAGIGIRLKRFYADFAYVYAFTKDASIPLFVDAVNSSYASNTFLLTLGWKFESGGNNKAKKRPYAPPPPPPTDNNQKQQY
jgi:hypothetical protein